jgi:carotenoid cleavage dioxygenase-like enzyme
MTDVAEHEADQSSKLPFHMRGNYAPVPDEIEAFDLPVIGAIPKELSGRYFRNGANPAEGVTAHWFAGDGMIHGLRVRDGKAEWYRNRYVRTKALLGVPRMDALGTFDLTVGLANTHIVKHGGRILALEEGSLPNELSPELETLGPVDFGGKLRTPFTAHPHVCTETGEAHGFGYELITAPFVTYHVVNAAGELIHTQPIDVGGPTMVHDFAISRNYAIFMDLPVIFDLNLAMTGGMPFVWDEGYGARIGLLHREGARTGATPRWFNIDLCYIFHILNAWDEIDADGHEVVYLDAGRHASMWKDSADDFAPSYLWRYRFDLTTGKVTEQQLDDVSHGFPRLDDRLVGLKNRYGYGAVPRPGQGDQPVGERMDAPSSIVKWDLQAGTQSLHDLGPTRVSGEPVFVPASDNAGEDEGYLMTFVYDKATNSSSFVVLDASDMSASPIAEVPIPQRVPHGFHGSWIAD